MGAEKESDFLNDKSRDEVLSQIRKIKEAARNERDSFGEFFTPIKESSSSPSFDGANAAINQNLGMANKLCHIKFPESDAVNLLSAVKNNSYMQENLPPQILDITDSYIYDLEANLFHHMDIEQCGWMKQKASPSELKTWGKQFAFKFLRPYFNVQKIFNEKLVGIVNVFIQSLIEERKALTGLGEHLQSFNVAIVRCLNEWVQKDIKKEEQFSTLINDLNAIHKYADDIAAALNQFKEFSQSRHNDLLKLMQSEGKGLRSEVEQAKLEYIRFSENLKADFQKSFDKESDSIRNELNQLAEKITDDLNGLSEQNIKSLKNESAGIRSEVQIFNDKLKADIYAALENHRERIDIDLKEKEKFIEKLAKHTQELTGNLLEELRENNIKILKSESEGVRAELTATTEQLKSDVFTALNNQKALIDIDLKNKDAFIEQLAKHTHATNEKFTKELAESAKAAIDAEMLKIRNELASSLLEMRIETDKKIGEKILAATGNLESIISSLSAPRKDVAQQQAHTAEEAASTPRNSAADDRSDFDFYAFEEWSRGSEEEIRTGQSVYIPYIKGCTKVLDLGCGRGEFLEILKSSSIEAAGIDMDPRMVARCIKKGLDVKLGDIISFLETLDSTTPQYDIFFAAQVVEHLTNKELRRFANLSFEKLPAGGKIILETVNPCCLSTFSGALYADPTHQKPVHPVALQFFLEQAGFKECKTVFSLPIPEQSKLDILPISEVSPDEKNLYEKINKNFEKLNSVLYTFAHYAIIAAKI